jgi:hypothetical protein
MPKKKIALSFDEDARAILSGRTTCVTYSITLGTQDSRNARQFRLWGKWN